MDEECLICYEEKKMDEYIWLECTHKICSDCYDRILSTSRCNSACPFCRNSIDSSGSQPRSSGRSHSRRRSQPVSPATVASIPISPLVIPRPEENLFSRSLPEESILTISEEYESNFYRSRNTSSRRNRNRNRRRQSRRTISGNYGSLRDSNTNITNVPLDSSVLDVLDSSIKTPTSTDDKTKQKFRNNRSTNNRKFSQNTQFNHHV